MKKRTGIEIIIFISLFVGLLIPLSISYFAIRTNKNINEVNSVINQNTLQKDHVSQLVYNIIVAESNQRGYCISGNKSYLATKEKVEANIQTLLLQIKVSQEDEKLNSLNLKLNTLTIQKLNFIADVAKTLDDKGINAAQSKVNEGIGKILSESIIQLKSDIHSLINKNNFVLEIRLSDLEKEEKLVDILGVFSAILVFGLTFFVIIRASNNRNKHESELLSSKEQLIESEKKFMAAFYNNPASTSYMDFDNKKLIEVNESYSKLLGYSKAELMELETSLSSMELSDADRAIMAEGLRKHGRFTEVETTLKTKDGITKNILISGTIITDQNGKTSAIYYLNDITERRLIEADLVRAKQAAENSANVKDQFLANMSHEIRTPLNAIIGFSNLLAKTELKDKQIDYLESVQSASANLLNITNDILDYSKLEAGMYRIEKINFDIKALVDSVFTMFIDKVEAKKIQYEYTIDEQIPNNLVGDPTRLTQILVNLLNNAIKFTNRGSIYLNIKILNSKSNHFNLEFKISDTGIGIDKENIGKIFERFNQAESTITRQYGGTGLGLAIVKRLIELQDGNISVESEPNVGSTFTFNIQYDLIKTPKGNSKNLSGDEVNIDFANKKVLLVEDNMLNQFLVKELIHSYGIHITVVENGQLALNLLTHQSFDLILMDLQMPVMDGYKATMQIRNVMALDIPIIAMSAHVLTAEKEKCISYGMNDYIHKPFNENDFKTIIHKYLFPVQYQKVSKDKILGVKQAAYKHTIDLSTILHMSKGNTVFIKKIIALYLNDTPIELEKLKLGIQQKDYSEIEAVAHKVKSSLNIIGLCDEGIEIMAYLELSASNHTMIDKMQAHLENFEKIFEASKMELKNYLLGL
jgi:PAS domain S-box-containing protein